LIEARGVYDFGSIIVNKNLESGIAVKPLL